MAMALHERNQNRKQDTTAAPKLRRHDKKVKNLVYGDYGHPCSRAELVSHVLREVAEYLEAARVPYDVRRDVGRAITDEAVDRMTGDVPSWASGLLDKAEEADMEDTLGDD